MNLEDFIKRYSGQVVSFDGVPENAGGSMQLIATWCKNLELPYRWPSPQDWFNSRNDDNFTEYWQYYYAGDVGAVPLPGDIVIFEKDLPGSDGEGHASIFIETAGEDWKGFDADWDGEVAHVQHHTWVYVKGWFTPIVRAEGAELVQEPPIFGQISRATMAPPHIAPNKDDTIHIVRDIPMYGTMSNALIGKQSIGTVPRRKYFVYKRLPNGSMNLTERLGQYGFWINKADLDAPLEPKWHELHHFRNVHTNEKRPLWFRATRDADIEDFDGKGKPLKIRENQRISIEGWFIGPDGLKHMAPSLTFNQKPREWYGMDESSLSPFIPEVKPEPPAPTPEPETSVESYDSLRARMHDIRVLIIKNVVRKLKERRII